MTPKMRAVLRVLRGSVGPMTPNAIGQLMERDPDPAVRPASGLGKQWRGGTMGHGSLIAPTLTALERRGLVRFVSRPDGMSGSAYRITARGRQWLMGEEAG